VFEETSRYATPLDKATQNLHLLPSGGADADKQKRPACLCLSGSKPTNGQLWN